MDNVQKEDIMIQAVDTRIKMVSLNNSLIHLGAARDISDDLVKMSVRALNIVADLETLIRAKVGM